MNYFYEHLPPEERERLVYQPTTPQFLDFIAEQYGQQIALSDAERQITYEELSQRVARRRHTLSSLRLPVRCNVGLFDINSIEAVEWFLALTTAGYTAVMLPASLSEGVLIQSAMHYELQAIIVGPSLREKTTNLAIPVLPTETMSQEGEPPAFVTKSDRACIYFTGGTTGLPKGVMLSHGAIMRGSLNGVYRDGTVYGQTMVAALPLTHVYGMICGMLSGLYAGAHIEVCGNMRELFKTMARVHPTTMIVVPGIAEMMLSIARSRGPEALGGRLKLIVCGAAPMPKRVMQGFQPLGIRVLSGYGLTETANLVSANLEQETHPDSAGKQYPCQESRVVDGELQVRGDMLFDGYWKNERTTAEAFDGEWFRTGDLVRIDEDGFIHIVGRLKNLIILSNGENVSPEEVENIFYHSPMVKECLVSETVIAGNPAIQLEVYPVENVSKEALRKELRWISDTLPGPMRPARFEIREEPFPKTASMKIARNG